MRSSSVPSCLLAVFIGASSLVVPTVRAQLIAPLAGEPAVLDRTTVPAAGSHAVELTVRRFGRYAIGVSSGQGVALTLVRRMSGAGASDGEPGRRDGRIDVLLERGRYLVRTRGDAHASGAATLVVTPFAERNAEPFPELVPLHLVRTTLGETDQRSWWLRVEEDAPPVILEAAGRCLADLRVWRDGTWLEPVEPAADTVVPEKGRPLRLKTLAMVLSPGLYLVTASGGPPEPWASGSDATPLFVRLGVPALPATGRQRLAVGPFGFDRWLVPSTTDLVNVDLPEPAGLEIEATIPDDGDLAARTLGSAVIEPKTRIPSAAIRTRIPRGKAALVTIRGAQGQPYLLETLDLASTFKVSGTNWITVVRTGFPGDSPPMTACILDPRGRPIAARAVFVGAGNPWSGRFDLDGSTTIFLWIEQPGRYSLSLDSGAAGVIEPFPVPSGRGYRSPRPRGGTSVWNLDGGLAILTIDGVRPGIVSYRLALDEADTASPPPVPLPDLEPVRSGLAVQFPAFDASGGGPFTVESGLLPGVFSGALVRPLPVDLGRPLTVLLEAGERLEVPVTLGTPSVVRAVTEDGDPVPLTTEGEPPAREVRLGRGRHRLVLSGPPTHGTTCTVEAIPAAALETSPLPTLPRAVLDARPSFPRLRAGAPPFPVTLAAGGHADLLIEVDRAGFWIARSTGLLDTTAVLTDRSGAGRFEDDDSGPGYNFQLPVTLESGVYSLRVSTLGSSAGTIGVELVHNDPVDGGAVAPGRDGHLRLGPWQGARFVLDVPSDGRYRVVALSPSGTPRCRLDDADGWPLEQPGIPARFERWFEAGEYGLVLLPDAAGRTVRVRLEPVPETPVFEGHGPHRIPFDTTVRHTWREPAGDGPRVPDVWTFDLPVPIPVRVAVTGGVTGRLVGPGGSPVDGGDRIAPDRPWEGEVPAAGTYRLEVRAAVPDDRLGYTVRVEPGAVLPGMSREFSLPAEVTVATPGGVTAIDTVAETDTTATLLDADGALLGRSDDRPFDWNPGFVRSLARGAYRVRIEPFGREAGTVRVTVGLRGTREHRVMRPPDHAVFPADGAVHVVPLETGRDAVLLASASAPAPVTLALERSLGGSWRTVATAGGCSPSLTVPCGGAPLRLRLWPETPGAESLELSVASVRPRTASLRSLLRGVATRPPTRGLLRAAAALVELGGPGILELDSPVPGLEASDAPDTPLRPVAGTAIPTSTGRLWLVTPEAATLRGRRLALDRDPVAFPVSAGGTVTLDLKPSGAPSAVRARSTAGTVLMAPEPGAFGMCRPGRHSTVLVLEPGADRLLVRLDGDGGGVVTLERTAATMTVRPFDGPADRADVPAGGLALVLPGGPAAWSLAVAADLAAAFESPRNGPVTVAGTGDEAVVTLAGAFERLLLLPLDGRPGTVSLRRLPEGSVPSAVREGAPAVVSGVPPGVLRLPVEAEDGGVLAAAGGSLLSVTPAGRIDRGAAVPVSAGEGAAWLTVDGTVVVAWLSSGDAAGVLAGAPAGDPAPCVPPCREVARESLGLAVDLSSPALVTVSLPAGSAARLDGPAGSVAWVQASDGVRHQPVAAGRTVLTVRSLRAGWPAEAALTTAPIVPAGEGRGDPVTLGPGEAVCFRFAVKEEGDVGVGVASDPDTATATLLDENGRPLGAGVVQMHTLQPGSYLLLVRHDGRGAVTVRPALAGLEPPPSGPPAEVVRHYLELSGRIR